MSALQALHRQLDAGAVDRVPGERHGDGTPGTSGAGHRKDALLLGIDVDEGTALEGCQIHTGSTLHTDLFVHGDDDFQRRMGNGLIRQQRQSVGHSDAVVTAQGGATGKDIAAIVGHIQTVGIHIDGAILILLADHVHMALNNDRLMVLQAAGALLEHDHIIQFILEIPDAVLLGKGHQIIGDQFGIPGTVGDGTDLFKISKNRRRLQTCQLVRDHLKHSLCYEWFYSIIPALKCPEKEGACAPSYVSI